MKAQLNSMSDEIKKPLIYTEAFMGYSTGELYGFGQNLILPNQWGIHFGFIDGLQKSKNLPDYYNGEGPTNEYNAISLRITKSFSENKIIRFKTELGIVHLNYETVHFIPHQVSGIAYTYSSSPNALGAFGEAIGSFFGYGPRVTSATPYTANAVDIIYKRDKSFGLSARLVSEFAISRVFGVHVAVLGTITKQHTFFGIETGIAIGRVREKRW